MERRPVSAIVLAGGRSSRFGSDKLAAELEGRPLLAHAIRAVAAVADEVLVVVAPHADADEVLVILAPDAAPAPAAPAPASPAPASPVIRLVRDRDPFAGPLAGLREGAAAARNGTLLVVGGDMPGLVPDVLRLLARVVAEGAEAAILGVDDPGAVAPLPMALDRAAATDRLEALLATERRSLRALLDELRTVTLAPAEWRRLDPEARTLHDVDWPEDLFRS